MRTMFDQVTTCISLDCLECRCPCVKAHRLRFSFFQQTDTILNEVGGFYKKKCECWNMSKHNASSLSSLSPIQPAQDRKGTRHFSKSNEHFKPWHQSKLWFSPWFYDKSISGGLLWDTPLFHPSVLLLNFLTLTLKAPPRSGSCWPNLLPKLIGSHTM